LREIWHIVSHKGDGLMQVAANTGHFLGLMR
jgi:hypothetical protein